MESILTTAIGEHTINASIETIPFLTRKFQKNKFYASFPLYFLHVFLVTPNLV